MVKEPAYEELAGDHLSERKFSRWEQVLCNQWGSSVHSNVRSFLIWTLFFSVISVFDILDTLSTGEQFTRSDWGNVLDVTYSLPLIAILMYQAYRQPFVMPRPFYYRLCVVAAAVCAACLLLEVAEIIYWSDNQSRKGNKRFGLWMGFALSDALAIWTWLNSAYFFRLLSQGET